jgi:predicted nuclease of predicted toxin-antitoxin system
MRILFDNNIPRGVARFLTSHSVVEARERGWDKLANGEPIAVA